MKFSIKYILATLFLICVSACSTVNRFPAEKSQEVVLSTDLSEIDKIKILLEIHKQIPALFNDASRFNIDLLKMIDDQIELHTTLANDPEFIRQWEEKKFLSMTIEVQGTGEVVNTKQMSAAAISSWKENLKKSISTLINSKKDLSATTLQMSTDIQKFSSAGFLNGLILNLPKEDQVSARKLQAQELWNELESYLLKHLPLSLVNFKTTPPEKDLSSSALIKKWKSLVYVEKSLGHYTDLVVLAYNFNLNAPQLLEKIDNLSLQDFDNLGDSDYQKNALAKLFNKNNIAIPNYYKKHINSYQSQTEVIESQVSEGYKIHLREQNPLIAIFRGCTGGDCSSQYSFPYPNDPNERVFFVYDKDHSLKGYVSATMVTTESGEKSLYAITTAGNRINSIDTDLILRALHQEINTLGVKSITLPVKERLSSLINFSPIRSIYESATQNAKKISIKYRGTEIRSEIENFQSHYNSGDYDHMKNNQSVMIYNPEKQASSLLKITTSEIKNPFLSISKNKIEPMALFEFSMALISSNRAELNERMLEIVFEDEKDQLAFKHMHSLAKSEKVLTTKQIENNVEEFAKNFNLDEAQIKSIRQKYLLNAYLGATDAFQSPYYEINEKRFLADFKFNLSPPLMSRQKDIYTRWCEKLRDSSNFQELKAPYLKFLIEEESPYETFEKDVVRFSVILNTEPAGKYKKIGYKKLKRLILYGDFKKEILFYIIHEMLSRKDRDAINLTIANALPHYLKSKDVIEEILDNIIKANIPGTLEYFPTIFSNPATKSWEDLVNKIIDAAIKRRDIKALNNFEQFVFTQPHSGAWPDSLEKIIRASVELNKPNLLDSAAIFAFSTSHASKFYNLQKSFIEAAIILKNEGALIELYDVLHSPYAHYSGNIAYPKMLKDFIDTKDWNRLKDALDGNVRPSTAYKKVSNPCQETVQMFLKVMSLKKKALNP